MSNLPELRSNLFSNECCHVGMSVTQWLRSMSKQYVGNCINISYDTGFEYNIIKIKMG